MLFSCFGGRIEKPDVLIWPLRVWNLLYKGVKGAIVYSYICGGVEYPVYAKVVKDLDVHVYPKTKKGADGTKPGCVFFCFK